jgi:uncharacterized phiE125 gp8 family phage protein
MSSSFPFGGVGPYGTYGNLGLYGALVAYGSLNLTDTSPQQTFIEPITVGEMQSYLKVPERSPVDQGEIDFLTALISAAREQAEILQGADLVQKQWDLNLDYWPSYRIEMRPPLQSVDLVQYTDSNNEITKLVVDVDYIVDKSKGPGILAPPYNGTWPTFTPWPSSSILIRFTSGVTSTSPFWSGSGARIKIGMKLLMSHWYNNRIPFDRAGAVVELPYAITSCLSYGSNMRAR